MPADLATLINSWDLSLSAEGKSRATIASYLLTLRQFIAFQHEHHAPTDVAKVRRADIEAWMVHLRDSRSPATARVRYASLQQFWKWAVDEAEIDISPMVNMRPPKVPVRVGRTLSADEVVRLRTGVGQAKDFRGVRDDALLAFFLSTGARAEGVEGLRLRDLDLKGGVARVVEKGDKERLVPIDRGAARAIDRYMRARESHRDADSEGLWFGWSRSAAPDRNLPSDGAPR